VSISLSAHRDSFSSLTARATQGEDVRRELLALKRELDALPAVPEPEQATRSKWERVREDLTVPAGAFGETISGARSAALVALEGSVIGAALHDKLEAILTDWATNRQLADESEKFAEAESARLRLLAEVLDRYAALLDGISRLGHQANRGIP
jgi:hypothetical protein